jgi:hypothetical protein
MALIARLLDEQLQRSLDHELSLSVLARGIGSRDSEDGAILRWFIHRRLVRGIRGRDPTEERPAVGAELVA